MQYFNIQILRNRVFGELFRNTKQLGCLMFFLLRLCHLEDIYKNAPFQTKAPNEIFALNGILHNLHVLKHLPFSVDSNIIYRTMMPSFN